MLSAARIYTDVRSHVWNLIPHWLQALLQEHFWRWTKYTLAAGLLFGLGSVLLYVEVHHLDLNRLHAHWWNTPIMIPLGFALNWYIWRERKTPWASGITRYALVTAVTITCSQSLYTLLAGAFNVQYLQASTMAALAVGIPHYIANNLAVFRRGEIKKV